MAVLGPSKNTRPERRARMCLVAMGVEHELHFRIPGTRRSADLRVGDLLVFIDGRFWHDPSHLSSRMSRYWRDKITANRSRDLQTQRLCRSLWFRTIRLWDDDQMMLEKLRAAVR